MAKKKKPSRFKKGDYIRKENYTPVLGTGKPVLKVKHATSEHINGKHCPRQDTMVLMTEEEAIALMEEWNEISISSTPVIAKPFVCVVQDTGEPKEPIKAFKIKEVYFRYKKAINPEIDAYKCPKCGMYHLGKKRYNCIASNLILPCSHWTENSMCLYSGHCNFKV